MPVNLVASVMFLLLYQGAAETVPLPDRPVQSGRAVYLLETESAAVSFQARHIPFSSFSGTFERAEAIFAFDERAPAVVDFLGVIDMTSFNPEREPPIDIAGPDWFALEQYPTSHFHGHAMVMTGEKTAIVHGDVTMKGITHPGVIDIEFPDGVPFSDPASDAFTFRAEMTVDRTQFGMTRMQGVVRRDIKLNFEGELLRQADGSVRLPAFALPPGARDLMESAVTSGGAGD